MGRFVILLRHFSVGGSEIVLRTLRPSDIPVTEAHVAQVSSEFHRENIVSPAGRMLLAAYKSLFNFNLFFLVCK